MYADNKASLTEFATRFGGKELSQQDVVICFNQRFDILNPRRSSTTARSNILVLSIYEIN